MLSLLGQGSSEYSRGENAEAKEPCQHIGFGDLDILVISIKLSTFLIFKTVQVKYNMVVFVKYQIQCYIY